MAYGFIYYAINRSMPGVTKIGMTTKHPELRLAELSAATGCPQPFELIGYFDTPQAAETERAIHQVLAHYRVNDRREFFAAPLFELERQALDHCDRSRTLSCYCMDMLEYLLMSNEGRAA
jgi:hypothetical protein